MHKQLTTLTRSALLGTVIAAATSLASPTQGFASDAEAVAITLKDADQANTTIQLELPTPMFDIVKVDGMNFQQPVLAGEAPRELEVGNPNLPDVTRSLRIPNTKRMGVFVTDAQWYDMPDMLVPPARGHFDRKTDMSQVPWEFSDTYQKDAFWPEQIAQLSDPWIMRDQRGIDVHVSPYQYNPATKTLRVYTSVTVEVRPVDDGQLNMLPDDFTCGNRLGWLHAYEDLFINWPEWDVLPIIPFQPEMLVIAPENWTGDMQPLVDHHNATGLWTYMHTIESIGNTEPAIRAHIKAEYEKYGISYVLLVGDDAHVTTGDEPNNNGGMSEIYDGGTDPVYGLISGNDHRPEVLVGRFSARTTADVVTQVERTISYENQLHLFTGWRRNALGIASADGEGRGDDDEIDYEHLSNIRDLLLANGWNRIDEVYDPGATRNDVADSIADKVGLINYTGHGSWTAFSTTGFNRNDVNALTNAYRLPWIYSVACQNGRFNDKAVCFAEQWLTATNDEGAPTGAVAAFMSTINQSWKPPMEGQDALAEELVEGDHRRLANLLATSTAAMIAKYDEAGERMFRTWTLFGDPALNLEPRELIIKRWWQRPWAINPDHLDMVDLEPRELELINEGLEPKVLDLLWIEDWIDVNPAMLVIEPGKSAIVTITINPEAVAMLPEGAYTASLVVHDLIADTADQGSLIRADVESVCLGDIDGDDTVGIMDLLDMLEAWGPCTSGCAADLDDNGQVDISDLLQIISNWGGC